MVGHSHVRPPELRTMELAHGVLVRMIHKAATRLRRIRYWAGCLTANVQMLDGPSWEQRVSLGLCRDTMTMVQALESIWPHCPIGHPFHVGVVLGNLVADGSADLPLYDEQHKRNRLADVMDQLDRKYGRHTLYFGGMMGVEDAAPTRISFTQIPTADEF